VSVPKVVGLEQEYGIAVTSPSEAEPLSQVRAAFLLVNHYERRHQGLWDYSRETPFRSALHRRRERSPLRLSEVENALTNNVLVNGARYYVDHAHPEYATPECLTVRDLVACEKAGERIVELSRQQASAALGGGYAIHVYKNNSDHKGNSYGCHENYLVEARTYRRLFHEAGLREFIPFLVSRQILCGAGKVGQENCAAPRQGYQISQRADFCETVFSIKTMSGRPLLNTRDEPHADGKRFRRLHVIMGDANMSEVSTYLKVGTTQLVLRMIEDGAITKALALDSPVQAVRDISLDPTCKARVKLRDGRKLSAIEIQREYLDMAHTYSATHTLTAVEQEVLRRWERTLHLLHVEPMELRREIDWVIKKWLIEQQISRRGLDWASPRLRQLDIQYHSLQRDRGLFYLLQASGQVERIVDEAAIEFFMRHPPETTRAYTRGRCLDRFGQAVWAVNWECLWFRLRHRSQGGSPDGQVLLLNPLRGTKAEQQEVFAQVDTAEQFVEACRGRWRERRGA
jgi:proteasome accessory factor A